MIQLIFINKDSIVSILDSRLRNLTQNEGHITLIKRRVRDERSLLKLTNNCCLYIERSVILDIEGQVISANYLSWVKIYTSVIQNVKEISGFKLGAALLIHGVDSQLFMLDSDIVECHAIGRPVMLLENSNSKKFNSILN